MISSCTVNSMIAYNRSGLFDALDSDSITIKDSYFTDISGGSDTAVIYSISQTFYLNIQKTTIICNSTLSDDWIKEMLNRD